MKTYRTAEIASAIGVHPNTVRFYEEQGLLPPVFRQSNGYRVYTRRHMRQLRLIRLGFQAEILSGNLRGEVVALLKTAAAGKATKAMAQTAAYQTHLREEMARARQAIALTEELASGSTPTGCPVAASRRQAAAQIGVSMDVLRDWERNGLVAVPRAGKRRQYSAGEMNRLKIISILRHANYSQMAIRRMFEKLEGGDANLLAAIDSPGPAEDIVSVADRYITSLSGALEDTTEMLRLLAEMQ